MSFEALKNDLLEANANLRSYLAHSKAYYKLKIFKVLMRIITGFAQALLIGAVWFLALLFLSLGGCIWIGQLLNNILYGFLIIGAFYMLTGLLCYFYRRKLDKPLLQKFSNYFFEET